MWNLQTLTIKNMELSTDQILQKVSEIASTYLQHKSGASFLDIGSGTGALIALIKHQNPTLNSSACDYIDSLMALEGQKVDVVDLSHQSLPYPAASFDLVTCTEVIEHLENYHRIVREVSNVLKPNGHIIFTTPNVLNLRSRLRFLFFGFWNMFGPLKIGRTETYSTEGHITPVSFFYLAHAIGEAGLELKDLQFDKLQRGSILKMLLWYPLIQLYSFFAQKHERRSFQTIDASNERLVKVMNGWKMLLGRTIIVVAQKPSQSEAPPRV